MDTKTNLEHGAARDLPNASREVHEVIDAARAFEDAVRRVGPRSSGWPLSSWARPSWRE